MENRLRAEGCDAASLGFLLDFRPVVSRENDDGRTVTDHLADAAHRFETIHIRHSPINDVDAIVIGLIHGKLCTHYRFLAAGGPVGPHADVPKHFADRAAGIHVIIHHQSANALELFDFPILRRIVAQAELEVHDEFRAATHFALHFDGTTHHIHNVFGDGHAKAGALDATDGGTLLAGKSFEEMLLEILAHADAIVFHMDFILCIALQLHRILFHAYSHRATGIGELQRITQKIQQHLIQTQTIAVHIFIRYTHSVEEKIDPLRHDVSLQNRAEVMEHIRQMHFLLLDLHHATLDAAHVKHVIDERQEMITGGGDFLQIVLYLILIIQISSRQSGEADDGIHRRTDIMGHIIQETGLRVIRMLRRSQCIRQSSLPLDFHALSILDIQKETIEMCNISFLIGDRLAHRAEPLIFTGLGAESMLHIIEKPLLVFVKHRVNRLQRPLLVFRMKQCQEADAIHFPLRRVAQEMGRSGIPPDVLHLLGVDLGGPAGFAQDAVHRIGAVFIGENPNGKIFIRCLVRVRQHLQLHQDAVLLAVIGLDDPLLRQLTRHIVIVQHPLDTIAEIFLHQFIHVCFHGRGETPILLLHHLPKIGRPDDVAEIIRLRIQHIHAHVLRRDQRKKLLRILLL